MNAPLPADEKLRLAFERYWKSRHEDYSLSTIRTFLKRDDVWGKGGYLQPLTNGDWLLFKAGADWQRKQR